jgi:hypothetical protein
MRIRYAHNETNYPACQTGGKTLAASTVFSKDD